MNEQIHLSESYYIQTVVLEKERTVFTLHKPKGDCRHIVIQSGSQPRLEELLLKLYWYGSSSFDFSIREKIKDGYYTIDQLSLEFGRSMAEAERSDRAQFYIDHISIAGRETSMTLNTSKDGCNQIVFQYGDSLDLKSIMIGLFENGKSFDFKISQVMGGGRCKISTISRSY